MSEQDPTGLGWRKSSRSGPNNNCVELALTHGHVAVRDSKTPEATLLMAPGNWSAFMCDTKSGKYDLITGE